MSLYRENLPQLNGAVFLTDGGLETTLIFHEAIELPHFAAFTLLEDADGRATLRDYYRRYADIAADAGTGFVLESPTWRANPDWGRALGYSDRQLARINREAIRFMASIREEYRDRIEPLVISGNIGPRGDGYVAGEMMSAEAAAGYHRTQIGVFAQTSADLVSAVTMTYAEEAIGIVRAANEAGLPVVISFTPETDGRLPSGELLGEALRTAPRRTSWSTAPTRITSAPASIHGLPGLNASGGCGPTHRVAATRNWTRRPSWMPVTPKNSGPCTGPCAGSFPTS